MNAIPDKFRKVENLHILLWLFKDIAWVSDFKLLGVIMIIPTLLVALWLTWQSRPQKGELIHNIAVVCWISANSVWMLGEFFFNDTTRPIAQFFFAAGITIILAFYLFRLYKYKTDTHQQEL